MLARAPPTSFFEERLPSTIADSSIRCLKATVRAAGTDGFGRTFVLFDNFWLVVRHPPPLGAGFRGVRGSLAPFWAPPPPTWRRIGGGAVPPPRGFRRHIRLAENIWRRVRDPPPLGAGFGGVGRWLARFPVPLPPPWRRIGEGAVRGFRQDIRLF